MNGLQRQIKLFETVLFDLNYHVILHYLCKIQKLADNFNYQ